MMGNGSAKIEADKAGVNLLFHILALFGMEMKQVKRQCRLVRPDVRVKRIGQKMRRS